MTRNKRSKPLQTATNSYKPLQTAANAANTTNPVRSAMKPMKKNKSDTDLELMGHMDDESAA
jgi:hypothetical protein